MKRPLRESIAGKKEPPFTSEVEVREAVAALRSRYSSVAEAEASAEWPPLHKRVTNWILRTALGLPVVSPEESARAIARVYLVCPQFLPGLPPAGQPQGESHDD